MPLKWETLNPGLGPTFGYDAAGVWVARVAWRGNGYEAWYDEAGLERPVVTPGEPNLAGEPVGFWGSSDEARADVDRLHERLSRGTASGG